MSFEREIKTKSNRIHELVSLFARIYKNDDDMFFKKAFFVAPNDYHYFTYDFDTSEVYFGKQKHQPFEELSINGEDTLLFGNGVNYETLLNKKIAENNIDKYIYMQRLRRQKDLTEEDRDKIRDIYDEIKMLLDHYHYNKERTQVASNFRDDVYELYCKYMYLKGLKDYNPLSEDAIPSVISAAFWWGASVVSDDPNRDYSSPLKSLYDSKKPTIEQADIFRETLEKTLMNELLNNGMDGIKIDCEYSPDAIFSDALMESNIDYIRLPIHTHMNVTTYDVKLKSNFKDQTVLYDSTTEDDINAVKEYYAQKNHVLKRTL